MQTSRFQIGLITALAAGLGATLTSSNAVGYPASAAISLGTNPVWSTGGGMESGSSTTVVVAPSDQDLVLTDVVMSPELGDMTCELIMRAQLSLDSGEELARYTLTLDSYSASASGSMTIRGVDSHYISGMRIPAGQGLILQATTIGEGYSCSSEQITYGLSGYSAQP